MKQIILILSILLFQIGVFAQDLSIKASDSGNFILNENQTQTELKIYPNPCKNNKVTIELNSEELSEIKLTNITGKVVLVKKVEFPENKLTIDLINIPNGIYLIQIKTVENKKVVRKLMVSN